MAVVVGGMNTETEFNVRSRPDTASGRDVLEVYWSNEHQQMFHLDKQSEDMQMTSTGYSELVVGVSVIGCSSLCKPCDRFAKGIPRLSP